MGTHIAIYKINERDFHLRKYTLLLPPFVTSFQALQLLMGLTQFSHSQTIAHDLDVALSLHIHDYSIPLISLLPYPNEFS